MGWEERMAQAAPDHSPYCWKLAEGCRAAGLGLKGRFKAAEKVLSGSGRRRCGRRQTEDTVAAAAAATWLREATWANKRMGWWMPF